MIYIVLLVHQLLIKINKLKIKLLIEVLSVTRLQSLNNAE